MFIDGKKVGVVTSGTVAPYWKLEGEGSTMKITGESERRAVAMALVDAALMHDQEVEVIVRERPLKARIVRWHGRSEAPPYFRPIPADWHKPERSPAAGRRPGESQAGPPERRCRTTSGASIAAST